MFIGRLCQPHFLSSLDREGCLRKENLTTDLKATIIESKKMKIPLCQSPDCSLELRSSVAADHLQPWCEDLTKGQGPGCPSLLQGRLCLLPPGISVCLALQSWCVCTGLCTLVTVLPVRIKNHRSQGSLPSGNSPALSAVDTRSEGATERAG